MAEFREKVAEAGAPQPSNPLQASVERILMSYGDQSFQELSRYRFAEEREWYEEALFYQRRQWLKWNDSTRRFDVIKQDPDRPKPMPVTNHYARTVNANANQLQKPRMAATAMDDSDANRRGAEFAQRAIKAIDAESGMDVLRPKLAKHDVLWGLGVTKDIIDTSKGTGIDQVAEFSTETAKRVSCLDCGRTSQVGGAPGGPGGSAPSPAGNQGQDADQAKPNMSLGDSGTMEPPEESTAGLRCPLCGSPNVTPYEAKTLGVANVHEFPKGKICTEIPPIFEIYLPRDCRDPNLAKRIIQRYRKPLGTLRSLYGDRAANIKAEAPYDVHQVYMEALRALVNYNYMHEQTIESTTITEVWADWDELPRKVQQRLEQFWEEDTESLEMAIRCGIYEIYAGGSMLDWGPNPWWDEVEQVAYKPYTFFLWELDPATVYNKGQGTDLVPLQKRLNRLDSLIELAFMCNAAGKWLWPTTQTGKPPSGSPNEVVGYEVIGEGKTKPEFVAPKAIDDNAFMLRMSILNDFEQIGNTLGVSQGQAPAGVKAFRGLAYLGQKAEEQINTQRGLWEKGHELRYKKCLLMAQKCWDAPRKVKIAGYNGKFGMMMLDGNALKGQYTLEFVADSSRPQLPSEKEAAFGKLLTAGMVDITDSAVREYVADTLNLDDVNMTDHLQYLKAERDLEKIKQGQIPQESPFQKWDVFLKVFANFALTEEFEALDPIIQQGILMYASHLSQMA
ncbi:MAG TPA: hypothetical protein VFF58_01010, partial [Candidatus Nitrosotalea sp.]|nr:hypothetical protein [Candidatus Nitrosotalea sp.]